MYLIVLLQLTKMQRVHSYMFHHSKRVIQLSRPYALPVRCASSGSAIYVSDSNGKQVELFAIEGNLGGKGRPEVGQACSVQHVFTQDAVNTFAGLCGDNNPLHNDPKFAATTMFGGTIVHGIFVSSLFSTLFGRSIHGSVYVSQNLAFKRPVHVGKIVSAHVEVKAVEAKKKGDLLTCSTVVKLEDGSVAVDGEAKVLLPYK